MAKKKEFSGKACLEASRWADDMKTWPEGQRERIEKRVDELLEENAWFQSADNHGHLSNLCIGLALYEMYLSEGKTKEEATRLTAEPMWAYVEKGAGLYRKAARIPGALKLIGTAMKKGGERWDAPGWEYTYEVTTSKEFRFTCHRCIYRDIYEKYGCVELGRIFCHADVINYGSLPGHTFTREHTLCMDGQECDFLITKDSREKRKADREKKKAEREKGENG